MTRKALVVMVMSLACSWSMAAERMALGLIVKMKDGSAPESVVRLQAAALPREQPQRIRLRLASAAHKAGISYVVNRPAAFAASVIHNGHPVRLREAQAQAARLRQDPDVEWVVVNELEKRQAVSSPILTDAATGGLPNVPAARAILGAETQTPQPVVVAVLDTGVLRHPGLGSRVLHQHGYDFVAEVDYANDGNGMDDDASDPGDYLTSGQFSQNPALYTDCDGVHDSSWHGTEVAGVLAADINNTAGTAGMLSTTAGAVVLPVRVAGQCGASVIDIIEGMLWAAGISYNGQPKVNPYPARVINLSFGGSPGCSCDRSRPTDGACLYTDAIATLKQKGAILVAPSGNSSRADVDGGVGTSRPASCPGALAVTALNVNGQKARYANFVPSTGIATVGGDPAPSVNAGDGGIPTTANNGTTVPTTLNGEPTADYKMVAGTSFSAPVVAGTVALMWAVNPGLSVDELLAGLRGPGVRVHPTVLNAGTCTAASPVNAGSCSCTTATCGVGVLDTAAAVQWAIDERIRVHGPTAPIQPYVSPSVTASFFNASALRGFSSSGQNNGGGNGGGGGGGGAVGLIELLCVVTVASILTIGRQRRRPH